MTAALSDESGVISQHFPSFNKDASSEMVIDYFNVDINLSYDDATGTVTLNAPELDLNKTFTGAGANANEIRKSATQQMKDFFKQSRLC